MTGITRRAATTAALAGAGTALLGRSRVARAQERPVNLKISLWVPPAHPLVPATREWAASVEKASGGTIKSTIFPSEQLGKAFDHYDMARDGIADITYVNPGYQPGRFPVISVGQIPFTFSDADKGALALDEWYRKYAPTEMKDIHYLFSFMHDPGTLHSRKKVVVPADLRGMKLRPAQSTIGQLDTLLGATNVQGSAPEARDMLDRGVAEAIYFPWGSVFLFGIDKVVRFHIDEPLYTTVFVYAMNKAKYESLSDAQRKVIDDHTTPEWAARLSAPWTAFEAAGRTRMRGLPGHEVYKLTPDQLAEWRRTVEPLRAAWTDSVRKAGSDPDAALAELQASIAKHGAGF